MIPFFEYVYSGIGLKADQFADGSPDWEPPGVVSKADNVESAILGRLGKSSDSAGTGTVFAWLKRIDQLI